MPGAEDGRHPGRRRSVLKQRWQTLSDSVLQTWQDGRLRPADRAGQSRELSTDPQAGQWHDAVVTGCQEQSEQRLSVVAASEDSELRWSRELHGDLVCHARRPLGALLDGGAGQGEVVGIEHLLRADKAVQGGQHIPALALSLSSGH